MQAGSIGRRLGCALAGAALTSSAVTGCRAGGGQAEADPAPTSTSAPSALAPRQVRSVDRILPAVHVRHPSDTYDLWFESNGVAYARFEPCLRIRVVVNDLQAPPVGVRLVRQALDRVSRATGLSFVLARSTGQRLDLGSYSDQVTYGERPPVLIAFTDSEHVPSLRGEKAGQTLPVTAVAPGSRMVLASGLVALDGPTLKRILDLARGSALARALIMHELGHVVGLNHVRDHGEIMHKHLTGQVSWGPGDRTGLALVGQGDCYRE